MSESLYDSIYCVGDYSNGYIEDMIIDYEKEFEWALYEFCCPYYDDKFYLSIMIKKEDYMYKNSFYSGSSCVNIILDVTDEKIIRGCYTDVRTENFNLINIPSQEIKDRWFDMEPDMGILLSL